MDDIVKEVAKLTKLVNTIPENRMLSSEKRDVLMEVQEGGGGKGKKRGRKAAKKLFTEISEIVQFLDPLSAKKMKSQHEDDISSEAYVLKEAAQHAKTSKNESDSQVRDLYEKYIQKASDDLLELAGSQLDKHKKQKNELDFQIQSADKPNYKEVLKHEKPMKTDNSLRKPQHAWW